MKEADIPSKNEALPKEERPEHWLHGLKRYRYFIASVAVFVLGNSLLLMLDSLTMLGAAIGLLLYLSGPLVWLIGGITGGIHAWTQLSTEEMGYNGPGLDAILAAVLSAFLLYYGVTIGMPFDVFDSPLIDAQGSFSQLLIWLITLACFLAFCVLAAFWRAHEPPPAVASEEEYQQFKRDAERASPHEGKDT